MKTQSNSSRAIETLSVLFFALVLFASSLETAAASAAPPDLMTYQGYLVDVNGAALATGAPANYPIVFRIYGASTGGNVLWSEQQIVTVDKGNFSVVLGEGTAVSGEARPALSAAFIGTTASDRYIGITVTISGTSMTISPRLRLLPSPYAFAATKASSLVNDAGASLINTSGDNVGIGATNPQEKLEIDGNLKLSPAVGGYGAGRVQAFSPNDLIGFTLNSSSRVWDLISITSANPDYFAIRDSTAGQNRLVITETGNVGIGTASPSTMLQIGEGANAGPGGLKINTGWINSSDYSENRPLDVQVRGSSKLVVNTQGNVGIGTSTPATTLDVRGTGAAITVGTANATDGALYLGNTSHGLKRSYPGAGNNNLGLYTTSGDVYVSGNGQSTAQFVVKNSGNVGIGTSTPRATLEVSGGPSFSVGNYGYLNTGGAGAFSGNNSTFYSIYAQFRVAASEFNAYSDRRIKEIVGASDTGKDLATIQKLAVTDYRMVDRVAEGAETRKGFIAQEVEKIIPEAVTQRTEFVPDIYAMATAVEFNDSKKSLTVTLPKAHGLKVGDRVRVVADDSKLELKVTAIPTTMQFVSENCEKAAKQLFVVGKEVSDFRVLNYDRIFTTGIGAIQALARQVEELKKSEARIAELEKTAATVAALEVKAARVDTLEHEVAELRKLVSGLAATIRNSPKSVATVSGVDSLVAAEVR